MLQPATCLQNRQLRLLYLAVGSCFALKISLTAISLQIKIPVPHGSNHLLYFLTYIYYVFHAYINMCECSNRANCWGLPSWENLCRTSCMTKHFVEIVHSLAMCGCGLESLWDLLIEQVWSAGDVNWVTAMGHCFHRRLHRTWPFFLFWSTLFLSYAAFFLSQAPSQNIFWLASRSCDSLQTPWLWNTKECWYNYPYQVKKPFNSLCPTIFSRPDVGGKNDLHCSHIYFNTVAFVVCSCSHWLWTSIITIYWSCPSTCLCSFPNSQTSEGR